MSPKIYNLDEIDVSKLPLPIREQLNEGGIGEVSYTSIQAVQNSLEPCLNEKTGKYHTYWMIRSAPIGECGSFTIVKTPWVSPRIDKYLEAIRIK